MKRIGGVSFLVLITFLALADYQISRILLEGSIFNFLRDAIREWMMAEQKTGGMKEFLSYKIYVLFDCPFCMVSQVGLWFCSLPIIVFGWKSFQENKRIWQTVSRLLFVWFMLGMATAGYAFFFWNIFSYPEKKLEIARTEIREKIRFMQSLAMKKGGIENTNDYLLGLNDFEKILVATENGCRDKCSCKIDDCRSQIIEDQTMSLNKLSEVNRQRLEVFIGEAIKKWPDLLTNMRKTCINEAHQFVINAMLN